jgi:hypothetical protein
MKSDLIEILIAASECENDTCIKGLQIIFFEDDEIGEQKPMDEFMLYD